MKNYFFINNHSPAAVYGIGTYASQIVKTIKEIKDINFIYVDISSDEVSFVETRDSIGLLHLKMPNVGTTMEDIWYNKCVYYYISKWVYSNCKKNDINVFHFNYGQHASIAYELKANFFECKIIFTVHYQTWAFLLKGNVKALKNIISKKNRTDNAKLLEEEMQVLAAIDAERKMLIVADEIIALSNFTRDIIVNVYNISAKKITVLPNSLPIGNIYNNTGNVVYSKTLDKKFLLYVGRLDDTKGLRFLLKSFRKIVYRFNDVHLIVVGDGDFSCLREADQIWEFITFTGRINHESLKCFYNKAYLGVHPSFNEQCSYTLLEMMKYGLPFITTDSTGIGEMVRDVSDCQIRINQDCFDEEEFVNCLYEKIALIIEHPEIRDKIQCQQHDLFLSNYANNQYAPWLNRVLKPLKIENYANQDMLSAMDELSFKIINARPEVMDLEFYGLGGIALYMLWRIRSIGFNVDNSLKIQEYLIYLMDWIFELLKSGQTVNELATIDSVQIFIEEALKFNFYSFMANKMFQILGKKKNSESILLRDIICNQMNIYNYFSHHGIR